MLLRRALAGATVLAVLACSEQPKEYVIGEACPQQAFPGMGQTQHGIELATREINRAGGIHGIPIRIMVRDDKAKGEEAVKVAAEFVTHPEVLAVVGHPNSRAMVAAARVYDGGGLPVVATTPTSPDLTGVSPWVFRMIPSDSTNGILLAQFAASFEHTLGHQVRAAVMYENDAYGRGLSDAVEHSFRGEIISTDPVATNTEFVPYVAYYKLHKPDVVFVGSTENVGRAFLHEAHRQHLTATFISGDGWQGVAGDSLSEGVHVGVTFTAQNSDTAARRFTATYRSEFGEIPDAHAALAYDAVKLIAQAISTVGPNRSKIRAYLAQLTSTTALHGVAGPTWFLPSNDPVENKYRITQVRHGFLIPVQQ